MTNKAHEILNETIARIVVINCSKATTERERIILDKARSLITQAVKETRTNETLYNVSK